MLHHRIAEKKDIDKLVSLWERSVDATHDFLQDSHKQEIKAMLPTYFSFVVVLVWYDSSQNIIGFSGTKDNHLEMLFIDPPFQQKGYGSDILQILIQKNWMDSVDVNKQNFPAYKFYQKNGFKLISESPTDTQGLPYPILHMQLD
ncbi:GNAT family N-acetyltransferase [Enterococcus larvae]|uniref:GNAT family N-acetyltransferase n=1 Tax=Enterococcus larvae TaxID=2794352 RepID=UPI003F3098BE